MNGEILTLGDALNYFGGIVGLVVSMVVGVFALARVGECWGRSACKRRHPASVARRAEIIAQRRAQLNRRGVSK